MQCYHKYELYAARLDLLREYQDEDDKDYYWLTDTQYKDYCNFRDNNGKYKNDIDTCPDILEEFEYTGGIFVSD